MRLTAEDVAAIERATLAAVAPLELVEDDGWLLAANEGAIGRANSVTALAAGGGGIEARLDRAFRFYAERGLPPMFRLSVWSQPPELGDRLGKLGFHPVQPTLVMIADAARVVGGSSEDGEVEMLTVPDAAWRGMFLGPGVAAAEAEKRTAALARGKSMRFAQIRSGAEIAAVGASNISGVWAGIHGMRTAPEHRRSGLARRMVGSLVRVAVAGGAEQVFLQVEADNAPAIALYEGLGFEEAYRYAYWRSPQCEL